jgi:hypothetical protein
VGLPTGFASLGQPVLTGQTPCATPAAGVPAAPVGAAVLPPSSAALAVPLHSMSPPVGPFGQPTGQTGQPAACSLPPPALGLPSCSQQQCATGLPIPVSGAQGQPPTLVNGGMAMGQPTVNAVGQPVNAVGWPQGPGGRGAPCYGSSVMPLHPIRVSVPVAVGHNVSSHSNPLLLQAVPGVPTGPAAAAGGGAAAAAAAAAAGGLKGAGGQQQAVGTPTSSVVQLRQGGPF